MLGEFCENLTLNDSQKGNVIVRDKELSKMNDEQLTIFRRRNIGFIFQNWLERGGTDSPYEYQAEWNGT